MNRFFFFLFFSNFLFAQQATLTNEMSLQADIFIGVDNYNNTYYVKDNVLTKETPTTNYVFQDIQLGPITSADIINPLNIVLFYSQVNTVVFLDNRLSEKERINFTILPELLNVCTATNAGNNRLWLFDTITQQLLLYDYRSHRKTIFSQPINGDPRFQISDFNNCYLLNENQLFHYNIYGSLLSQKDIDGFTRISQNGKKLIGLKDNRIYYIENEALIPVKIDISENTIKDLQLTHDFLYIYDGNKLFTFTLNQPKQ